MTAADPRQISFAAYIGGYADAVFAGHYYPAGNPSRRLLQILVHGVSYDHRYWDAGQINGSDYSYARYMTERGYDILAMDLPGTGSSSKPDGDSVALESVGKALARVAETVRGPGGPLNAAIDRVALVGHSLGSIVTVYTQAWWQPADLLVVTGTGYYPSRGPSPYGTRGHEEAMRDAYACVPPEVRRHAFYYEPMADPQVIEFDNLVLRTSLPRRLWADALRARDDLTVAGLAEVACPVYMQLGEHDPIMPGSLAQSERECWPARTEVVVEQVAAAGHCLNLHLNHEEGWQSIDRFLREH